MKTYTINYPDDWDAEKRETLNGKKEWTEALRSGKFSQARGKLADYAGYCCLGVLCEVQGRLGKVEKGYQTSIDEDNPLNSIIGRYGELPFSVSIIDCANEDIILPRSLLSDLNDNGLNFKQIADIIDLAFK